MQEQTTFLLSDQQLRLQQVAEKLAAAVSGLEEAQENFQNAEVKIGAMSKELDQHNAQLEKLRQTEKEAITATDAVQKVCLGAIRLLAGT